MPVDPDDTQRKMRSFVDIFRAEVPEANRFDLRTWLARRSPDAATEVEGVQFGRGRFRDPADRSFEAEFLDIWDALQSTRIEDPVAFGAFLAAAATCDPSDAFCSAVTQVLSAHLYRVERTLRTGADANPHIVTALTLQSLADGARGYPGAADDLSRRCEELALWVFEGTARAHLLAEQSRLFDNPTDVPYGLHNLHIDCSATRLAHRWDTALEAVRACPPSGSGTELRRELLARLNGLLVMARADLESELRDNPGRYQDPRVGALGRGRALMDTYMAISLELEDLGNRPGFNRPE